MLRRGCQVLRRYASTSSSLKKPQYDLKSLRANPAEYDQVVQRRGVRLPGGVTVKDVVITYEQLIQAQKARNDLVHERNKIQKKVEKAARTNEGAAELKDQLVALKRKIKEQDARVTELEAPTMQAIDSIPNLIASDVSSSEQLVGELNADKRDCKHSLDHLEIASRFAMVDLDAAARVSGSSWYYLMNDGALLEQALVQYAISTARKHGFGMITPPSIVRQDITNACGFKPRDQNGEQQVYLLEQNLCLTGTAEIALAGWAAHKTLHLNDGPLKKVGVSRSYRAEAGARGKDTKGLYRVHEFTKVELFCWTRDSVVESNQVLEELLALQRDLISGLGLRARVLNMPENDLGAPAYKKYDIEAWIPSRGWGEVTSSSNCLDYQARRLHTKYQHTDGTVAFTHTLNGTAMAVPRIIIAILENNYDPDHDRILIPEPLRKWMDDKMYITKEGLSFVN